MSLLKPHTFSVHNNQEEIPKSRLNHVIKIEVSNLKCNICNIKFDDIDVLKCHLQEIHKVNIDTDFTKDFVSYKLMSDLFTCHICSKTFNKFIHLSNHFNQHFKNYICDNCGAPFVDRGCYNQHLLTHNIGSFPCNICDLTFKTIILKRHHVTNVHIRNGFKFICPHCPERFKEYSQRLHHMAQKHNVKNKDCTCSTCRDHNLDISTPANKSKMLKCNDCSKTFSRRGPLRQHILTHLGVKFACEICEKLYSSRKSLSVHLRIHNNERRFVCVECGKGFIQKRTLQNHMRVHFIHEIT